MARPARLEDDQLRVEVEEGTAINESVRLYTGPIQARVHDRAPGALAPPSALKF